MSKNDDNYHAKHPEQGSGLLLTLRSPFFITSFITSFIASFNTYFIKSGRPNFFKALKRWQMLLFTLLYVTATGASLSASAASQMPTLVNTPTSAMSNAQSKTAETAGFVDFFAVCEQHQQACMEWLGCDSLEECRSIIACLVDEDECEEMPHCEEDEEECEARPECEEEEEECEDMPECDEEDSESCDEGGADGETDGENDGQNDQDQRASGFVNPNPVADKTIMLVDTAPANAASRFLAQATLGADYALITQVASFGEDVWLESQFNEQVGYLTPYTQFLVNAANEYAEQVDTGNDEQAEDLVVERFGDPEKFHQYAWWTQVMTSPDLVRQRVAMALSEIFVVSNNVEALGTVPYSMSGYYDTLLTHSFGNFRDLLKAISLNPAMGVYLSHIGNQKANPQTGTFPDENYAREVMQLFSIGLFELNPDGSRKQDASGNDIPTYGQAEIREFAKIFTGLNFDTAQGFGVGEEIDDDLDEELAAFLRPMKMYDEFHSTGEKRLLNGQVVPAGQTGAQDIDAAIDNLFNHPNVAPFIGKQLIQRLVTSNPSPAYVSRVTAAFNGNNATPRGDMKAVIRAILLDPEARPDLSRTDLNGNHGRLREPFLRLLRLKRMFDTTTIDRTFNSIGLDTVGLIKQNVMYSPSVFNFFQPGYAPNGELRNRNLLAPEFQIVNASTIMEIKNLVDFWLESGRFEESAGLLPVESVSFAAEVALADNPDALLDRLDTVMTLGTLTPETRSAIKTVLENEPDRTERVKKAIYLIAVSPDYAVAL